jgi:hypothetical protein
MPTQPESVGERAMRLKKKKIGGSVGPTSFSLDQ